MANIDDDILDKVHEIFRSQAVTQVDGTYELDGNGTLTFTFSDTSVVELPFKYVGVERNAFVERLMDTGGLIIQEYRKQFNPPPEREAFFESVTE